MIFLQRCNRYSRPSSLQTRTIKAWTFSPQKALILNYSILSFRLRVANEGMPSSATRNRDKPQFILR